MPKNPFHLTQESRVEGLL